MSPQDLPLWLWALLVLPGPLSALIAFFALRFWCPVYKEYETIA